MKLVRFGKSGQERPGLIDADGNLRDLSAHVNDIAGDILSRDGLSRLRSIAAETLPLIEGSPRLGVPVANTRNFIGIGLNYADHAAETGATPPTEPIIFIKAWGSLAGAHDDVELPPGSTRTDWEAELAVVIGETAKRVTEDAALDHVAGYAVCLDVSEREWQNDRGGSWDKGKGFDGYGPVGPWLVTPDEAGDPQSMDIDLDVDGVAKQRGNTRTMIFPVAKLISYVSHCITLHPGDIIATGTPPGVGIGRRPQEFLRSGQTVKLSISRLGEQVHRVTGG